MYSVFASKRFVNNKGFIGHECGEKFVETKQQAIKNANKKLQKFENDEKVFAYIIWIAEYENNIEIGERELVGEKRKVAFEDEHKELNSIRNKMGLELIK